MSRSTQREAHLLNLEMRMRKDIVEALSPISTATITTILLKKGLRRVWMRGAKPIRTRQARAVGAAFTLRFVPAREDLATPASWASPRSTRAAIEDMPEGCVAVADAMGVTEAGIFGDILCARMKKKGVAGLVTDGVVRDIAGVLGTGLPVGATAPRRRHPFPASPLSTGRNRSGVEASPCFPAT
jgi:regulator of RNase E activity RraA